VEKSHIFNRSGTDGLKTRTFLKTRPYTRTGAEIEDVSGETRTYGNPIRIKAIVGLWKSQLQIY